MVDPVPDLWRKVEKAASVFLFRRAVGEEAVDVVQLAVRERPHEHLLHLLNSALAVCRHLRSLCKACNHMSAPIATVRHLDEETHPFFCNAQ